MKSATVLITGCGYRPIDYQYKYRRQASHDVIRIQGEPYKMNIGTAVAYRLSKKGYDVIISARRAANLEKIRIGLISAGCDGGHIEYVAADLTTSEGIRDLVKALPVQQTLYWVHSIGLSAGAYKIRNDNVYRSFETVSAEMIRAEMEVAIVTHETVKKLMPVFRRQVKRGQRPKICVITSMSGERGYHFGSSHVAAKHALVGYIKGIRRELADEGVDIFDVRPGAIDTGMYDNQHTRKAVLEISRRTKMWGGRKPIFAPPRLVAAKVERALFSKNRREVIRVLAPHQT